MSDTACIVFFSCIEMRKTLVTNSLGRLLTPTHIILIKVNWLSVKNIKMQMENCKTKFISLAVVIQKLN